MTNKRIEPVWLAHSLLDELVLIYPVYAIMIQQAGISGFELSVLFVIWSASSLIFEIPSGVIGDLVSRRHYLGVGALTRAAGFLVWLTVPTFAGFATGFVLWGLGGAIYSGTRESLLHDVLAEQGREEAFARIYGRGQALARVGVFMAMAIGGFAAKTGYTWPLLLSAVAPLAAVSLLFGFVREPARSYPSTEHAPRGAVQETPLAEFTMTLRAGVDAVVHNGSLAFIVVMFIVLTGVAGVVDEYIGVLLAETGAFELSEIGLLYGTILGSQALGAAFAHRLLKVGLPGIALLSAAAHTVLYFATLSGAVPLALLCGVYFLTMGVVGVLLESHLQREIESNARATITSIAGAGLEAWGICLYLAIGALADATLWKTALGVVAAVTVLAAAVLAYIAPPVAARRRW